MPATLAELAVLVNGTLRGDPGAIITGANVPGHAGPSEITLVDRAERLKLLTGTRAAAVVMPRDVDWDGLPVLAVDDIHAAFAKIIHRLRPPRVRTRIGISPAAHVSPRAKVAANVDIHPGAVIEDDVEIAAGTTIYPFVHLMAGTRIGADVTIFSHAVLYEDTVVGPRTIIHAGAVIGCYGFGYASGSGRHERSAQLGHVEIGADVEVGAGTTIDRGAYGPTVIGDGTKIDNQVQIAHNCQIGRHNLLCSQVGIAGSTSTGDYVVMAGQVGVRDHVRIGEHAVLAGKAGVSNDVPAGQVWLGCPATREREQKLMMASYSKLPEMRRQLRLLQRAVERLEKQTASDISAVEDKRADVAGEEDAERRSSAA